MAEKKQTLEETNKQYEEMKEKMKQVREQRKQLMEKFSLQGLKNKINKVHKNIKENKNIKPQDKVTMFIRTAKEVFVEYEN